MAAEWSVLKRARRCLACGTPFADGDGYSSVLLEGGEELAREDYCAACWGGLAAGKRDGCLSCWRGRFREEPAKAREEAIGGTAAERLLRRYAESAEPAHVNLRYILAVMLERRKKLIPRDTIVEGGGGRRIIVYEFAGSGESILVEDPGIGLSQAREVQEQIRSLLDAEGV
ncbi:MAG: hypothetical protein PHN82_10120 [bacterium]|nr:hypothetical protein [bacterium]